MNKEQQTIIPTQELFKCDVCDHIGKPESWLTAQNPFDDEDTITGCPKCKCVGTERLLCEEPRCRSLATCGTPVKDERRYVQTCGIHQPYKMPAQRKTPSEQEQGK